MQCLEECRRKDKTKICKKNMDKKYSLKYFPDWRARTMTFK